MKKNSIGHRSSLAQPLRVRNDGGPKAGSSQIPVQRLSSERRRSSSEDRFSFGGRKSYSRTSMSSAMGMQKKRFSGLGARRDIAAKDPRPVTDRGHQTRCIRRLLEFLIDNGYPHNISQKILHSPPTKDFMKIFEFLYSFLEPSYSMSSRTKVEEEIPRLLKQLGYPIVISKSSMFAIGSLHTWPNLLAALTWLLEVIEIGRSVSDNIDSILFPPQETEFDTMPESKLKYLYIETTYDQFLAGKNEYDEQNDELDKQLHLEHLGDPEELESLAAENSRLTKELDILHMDENLLKSSQGENMNTQVDVKMFKEYLHKLDGHLVEQDKHCSDTDTELALLISEHQTINANIERMQQIFNTQEFSQGDVDRIRREQQELQRQIDDVDTDAEAVDSDIWSKEMAIGGMQEGVQTACREFNTMAQSIKLIPAAAENAGGIDFEMRPDYHSLSVGSKVQTVIKPALTNLKKQCQEDISKQENLIMNEGIKLEHITELAASKEEDVHLLDSKLKRLEDDIECKKEMHQREAQSMQANIDQIQHKNAEHQKSTHFSKQEAYDELLKMQKWSEEQRLLIKRTDDENCSFMTTVTQEVLLHKEAISLRIQQMKQDADEELQRFMNEEGSWRQ